MKPRAVNTQPFRLLPDHLLQFISLHAGAAEDLFIQHQSAILSQSANGEFTMARVANFADHERVERTFQDAGDFGGDQNTAARQTQHEVSANALARQITAEFLSRLLPVGKGHA